jgi:diguanylate cyclase (GGDEF)-like protein/PAS domain S-box-containing protein
MNTDGAAQLTDGLLHHPRHPRPLGLSRPSAWKRVWIVAIAGALSIAAGGAAYVWLPPLGAALAFAASAALLGVALAPLVALPRVLTAAQNAHAGLRESAALLEGRIAQLTHTNRNLAHARQELHVILEQSPLPIAIFDLDMRYVAASRRWIADYGSGRTDLTGLSHYELHPATPQSWRKVHRRALAGESVTDDGETWIVRGDGSKHWLRWLVGPWRNEHGGVGGIIAFVEDVTERKHTEQRLRLADAVFTNTQEGIVVTDLAGRIVAVNPAFSTITEYSEQELVGRHMSLLSPSLRDTPSCASLWEGRSGADHWQGEVRHRRKSGEIFPQWLTLSTVRDEAGEPTGRVGVVTDVSRMQHAHSHLQHHAHHDSLTGLPNRSLLYLRLRHTIERTRRDAAMCAVLFLDLDGFKRVNDTRGHEAGDQLLRLAARRMKERLRDIDTLARVGGDEFVAVLEHVATPGEAAQVAQALIERLSRPFRLANGRYVTVGASIGISLYPADGTEPDALIRNADRALYRAKAAGRGTWRFQGEEPCAFAHIESPQLSDARETSDALFG